MVKHLRFLYCLILLSIPVLVNAQLVGSNMFLQGRWLEVGLARNGSMGSTRNAPTGYHPRSGGGGTYWDPATCTSSFTAQALASVYDWGHDGWTTGTPNYMGDYTLPGSPWEGWAVQVGTTVNFANFTSYQSSTTGCNGFTNSSGSATTATSGSFTSYSSTAGRLIGMWEGTTGSGTVGLRKEYRVDTLGSSLVVTVVFTNLTSSPTGDIYYFRGLDPDNNQTVSGGSFSTNNTIVYQNDALHRVLVTAACQGTTAAAGSPPVRIGLGTKDCRAKCFIFSSWPLSSSVLLSNIWSGTYTGMGTTTTATNATQNGDVALGLVYNIGAIPANDSAIISYAYIYDGNSGIDSAFPEPKIVVNGIAYDSTITDTVCTGNTLPVNLINANDKGWSWGHWTWTGGPAGALASDTGVSNVVNVSVLTGVTTFTIVGTDSAMGSCATKTFLLTVIPVSSPGPIVRDTTYCQGITAPPLDILVTSGTGLTWYTTPTGGIGTTTAPVPSTTTLGTYTWYVSQTILGCESERSQINITIAAPPTISLVNNGPLCPGDHLTITLTDGSSGPGATYSWTGPGGFTAVSHDVNINPCAFTDSGVYTVTVNNSGCMSTASDLVVVHSTPPSPVFTNPTYCQFLPSVPLSATGSNILWYTSATGGVGSPTAPTPSTLVAGVFTWYVTQTINNCESARYPVTVTVNAKPVPPTITNNPGNYCPGQPFNTYTIVLGSNILWYTGPTGGTGTPTAPTVNTSVPGTYINWASQTVLGCESDRSSVTVTVYDRVTSGFTHSVRWGCNGDTVLFANTSTGAINYLWDFGDGTSSIALNPTHIYLAQGVYTVKLFAHSANCVDSMITTIDLRHPNNVSFTSTPQIVCQGSPVLFNSTADGAGVSYWWNFGDGQNSSDSDATHAYVNTGTYNVSVVVTDFVPCKDTAYGVVYVDSASNITMTVSDTAYCLGGSTTVAADYTTIGETEFVWNFGNGDSIKNVNPVIYGYTTSGIFTISATARYRACPEITTSRVVHVFDQPLLYVGEDFSVCEGSTAVTLADLANGSNPYATWLWSTGETTSSISVTTAGVYHVVVNVGGCTASDSVIVNNDCSMALANIFSPNGDGVNDYFNPRLYLGEGLKNYSMTIYNRWGQVVFETKNLEGRGWDGRFNDQLQPVEVYVYTLDATYVDGKHIKKNGNVTLIR